MTTVKMVEYDAASEEVRAVYDEIMTAKGIDFVPNFWKTVATHPPMAANIALIRIPPPQSIKA